ncbi:MAG: efflux RND transporter periplasmic adaptor subunit [Flammeovirgaceae bacterium]
MLQQRKSKLACILIPSLLLALSCKEKAETTTPTVAGITESVYASGRVKSRDQYSAYATVTSIIEETLVQRGDHVKAGQPIARLRNAAAQLASENAKLASRFAEMEQNKEKLNELLINVQLAKEKMTNDSLLMVRQNNLHQQNIGSQVEWEQRTLAFENSAAAYRSALIRYNELQRQLKLTADQARISYNIATQQLGDFTITSKVDGRLYTWLKEKGELVNPQTAIAVLGNAEHFLLELEIDETDIGRVSVNQRAIVTLSSYPDQVWNAVVTRIFPIMNERSKLFTVEAEFDPAPKSLYPNLTAEANIVIQTKEQALLIPRAYLVNDSSVLLESGKYKKIKCGLRDYEKVEILEGLDSTDVIVKPGK